MLDEPAEILPDSEMEGHEFSSFNHSFICNRLLKQLFINDQIEALPELTLNIEKGITPDISIYPKEKIAPDFLNDYAKYSDMPLLAIEIISASQNIQDLLEKSKVLVKHNVKAVWTIEPFTNTIFVTTPSGIQKFPSQVIESEGITVDFKKIFG
jgi:Uma2 family endonuclease